MKYEMIREIFNQCSGNRMRDVFVSSVDTEDPETYVKEFLKGRDYFCDRKLMNDGTIIFDVTASGIHQRFSFTEDD